jgi:hypothetical protein
VRPFFKVALAASISVAGMGATPQLESSGAATFNVSLSGDAEVNVAHPWGGTGDPGASGYATLSINPATRQVCYDFRLSGVSDPMMAHVHQGLPLQNGPPVVILFVGTRTSLTGCTASTRSQLSQIVANPAGYYVSIDSTDYPDGALRGQL